MAISDNIYVFIYLIIVAIVSGFLALPKTRLSGFIGMIGPTMGLIFSIPLVYRVLWKGMPLQGELVIPFPFQTFQLQFTEIDAVFMIPLLIVGFTVALFALCITKPEHAVTQPHFWFFLNIMYAGVMITLVSGTPMMFLYGWELMSWAAFFLICTYYKRKDVRDAGIIYFIVAHLSFLLILIASFLFDYNTTSLPSVVFLVALIGFGSKAGVVPFHVWLPDAHAAAPGHVSALLGGVMCNMGLYVIWRLVSLDMVELEAPPHWWGYALLITGAVSALYGALMALAQHNLKRLLAYSVIENTGVLLMGIGLGFIAWNHGYADIRDILYAGCALQVINHAIFKSLLFMAAGTVINQTGATDINYLGGLLKKLPVTGVALLIGCAAAAGLPPFNGFIGEFMLFYGGIASLTREAVSWQLLAASIFMLAVLGLAGGLTLVCFTKLAGLTILGEPRSKLAEDCVVSNLALRYSLCTLIVLCLVLGVGLPFVIPVPAALWKMSLGLLILIGMTLIGYWLRRHTGGARLDREKRSWTGGYSGGNSRLEYSGSAYVQPITSFLKTLLRLRRSYRKPEKIFPESTEFSTGEEDMILEHVYRPFFKLVYKWCMALRFLQDGQLSRYVLYIVLILLFLLVWKLW